MSHLGRRLKVFICGCFTFGQFRFFGRGLDLVPTKAHYQAVGTVVRSPPHHFYRISRACIRPRPHPESCKLGPSSPQSAEGCALRRSA